MSLLQTIDEIEYPESDGKPMGETDIHIDWMIRIRDILRYRYEGRRVYVGANLLVYYKQGDASKFVVPDCFVVKNCRPGRRRTFKIWEEGRRPNVVFEITSRSSRDEDEAFKPQIYVRLGVAEYFLYDPTGEYLDPPLQGFRLAGTDYVAIKANKTGALKSDELGILLRLAGDELVLVDAQSDSVLMTKAEAMDAARQAAETGRQAEAAARKAAEADRDAMRAQAEQLKAEVERLKKELARKPRRR